MCAWSAARSQSPSRCQGESTAGSLLQSCRADSYDRRTRHTTRGDARGGFPGTGVRVPPAAGRGAIGRRTLLKRGLATACRPHRHLVARDRPRGEGEGARGPAASRDQAEPVRARRGGQEGRAPERDRVAARLGELRRDHLDVHEEVRHPDHERQPERQLVGRRTRRSSRSRAIRALRTSSTSARRSRSPAPSRASTPGTTSATTRPSRGR